MPTTTGRQSDPRDPREGDPRERDPREVVGDFDLGLGRIERSIEPRPGARAGRPSPRSQGWFARGSRRAAGRARSTDLFVGEPVERLGSRLRSLRRRRIRRTVGAGILGAALVAAAVLVPTRLLHRGRATPRPAPTGGDAQRTSLVIMTLQGDLSQRAESLTLWGVGPSGENPVVLFVPTSTLAEIPGEGYEPLGKANSVGGEPLEVLTVENLLGIDIDHYVSFNESALAALVDRAGGVTVEVPNALYAPNGPGRLVPVFQPGSQRMDGATAVRYFTFLGQDETQLDQFVRQRRVWDALLAPYAAPRSADLAALFREMASKIATADAVVSDAAPEDVGSFFEAFAAAAPGARTYEPLPVEAVVSGGDAYRADPDRVAPVIDAAFAGSRIPAGVGSGAQVEIRNGNGAPGIGARAAAPLVSAGMHVALTGNAPSFDVAKTKILIYDDDPSSLALAERVRALLGAGEVEITRRGQTIVDVTVVLGHDFPPSR